MDDSTTPVALVTGASRGIGRACAIALAHKGYDVAVSARTLTDGTATLDDDSTVVPGGLDTTVAAIEAAGRRGFAVRMDLLDRESVHSAVDASLDHFGRIDLLLNNGIYQGPGSMTEFIDLDEPEMLRMFEGNVFTQLDIIRRVLPDMRRRGSGVVMNMISATAYIDPPARIGSGGWGMCYAMTKAALARVAPLLKVELGHEGLRFFSIDPGHVATERQKAARRGEQFSRHDTGATPEVIGAAVAWLATDPEGQAELDGQVVHAQRECKRRQLLPGWPPPRD